MNFAHLAHSHVILSLGEIIAMPTVLLIEDDPESARMVVKLLRPHGFTVEHAALGLAGLELARNCDIDLILVDINLPDISGNVVIFQLRATLRCKQTPIIAFTAETSDKARRIASALGCDGFLTKPINTQTFPAQVDEYIKRKHA